MRRSSRIVKPKKVVHQEETDEEGNGNEDEEERDGIGLSSENSSDDLDEQDSSADEWQPDKSKDKKGKRGRGVAEESDESEDDEKLDGVDDDFGLEGEKEEEEEEEERTIVASQRKKRAKTSNVSKGEKSKPRLKKPPKASKVVPDEDILAAQAAIEEEERDERDEAQREAAEMWKQVRLRKEGRQAETAAATERQSSTATPTSLTSWLGIPEPAWPTTCDDAMINDRDSLFVGYVYSLTTPSQAVITQMLSHLGKIVHPKTIPTERLPPAMQHLASNRRGATHDMHAWRCLALKRGRSGLNGPEDFGLEEGLEDDGEKFGAKEIAKVIKQLGATDVLVIVSRWYGGTMLGPIRFQHIESCARAALGQFMIDEALVPLKEQLKVLDDKLATLRSRLGANTDMVKAQYDKLDFEKAERLVLARKRAIEMLQKRIDAEKITLSSPPVVKEVAPIPKENSPIAPQAPVVKEEEDRDLTGWDALE